MKQAINMGGFKNETVEVHFGEDTYQVKLDPPIEAYRMILEMKGNKLETEEDWDKYKQVVTMIICKSNPGINEKEFFKSLTKAAATSFLNPFADLLFKKGGSKNPTRPPKKHRRKVSKTFGKDKKE